MTLVICLLKINVFRLLQNSLPYDPVCGSGREPNHRKRQRHKCPKNGSTRTNSNCGKLNYLVKSMYRAVDHLAIPIGNIIFYEYFLFFFRISEWKDQLCRLERMLENCLSRNHRLPVIHRLRIVSQNRQQRRQLAV